LTDLTAWLTSVLGATPTELSSYQRALTHSSHPGPTYERLEFLGDRVLGLVIAEWLCELHPEDPEGKLSHRLNSLVARVTCAQVGRAIGLPSRVKLGKQALEDGAFESDNVLGDVVEALIGALYLDHGLASVTAFIKTHWASAMDGQTSAPRHPKSALQEWAAAHNRKPPHYQILDRLGADHAPRFRVKVSVGSAGEAEAEGSSKQEAETAAAAALLESLSA
jgi:ribonuclease III